MPPRASAIAKSIVAVESMDKDGTLETALEVLRLRKSGQGPATGAGPADELEPEQPKQTLTLASPEMGTWWLGPPGARCAKSRRSNWTLASPEMGTWLGPPSLGLQKPPTSFQRPSEPPRKPPGASQSSRAFQGLLGPLGSHPSLSSTTLAIIQLARHWQLLILDLALEHGLSLVMQGSF